MNTSTLIDTELLYLLKEPSKASKAIGQLYVQHFDSLSQFVINQGGSQEDAQDIFQEVLVGFTDLVQRGKFRGESSIKTFLFAMNRNLWYNELKRRGRVLKRETIYDNQFAKDERIERIVEAREASSQVLKILDDLGEACKKLLVHFYYENRSMKEIAPLLSYENEQVVRNKKHKCLKKLEGMLAEQPGLMKQLKNLLHG